MRCSISASKICHAPSCRASRSKCSSWIRRCIPTPAAKPAPPASSAKWQTCHPMEQASTASPRAVKRSASSAWHTAPRSSCKAHSPTPRTCWKVSSTVSTVAVPPCSTSMPCALRSMAWVTTAQWRRARWRSNRAPSRCSASIPMPASPSPSASRWKAIHHWILIGLSTNSTIRTRLAIYSQWSYR